MEFKNTIVSNFQGAFRGLRNPLESWEKSDSVFGIDATFDCDKDWDIADLYCKRDNIDFESKDFFETEEKYATWLRNNGVLRTNDGYTECIEYAFIGPNDLDLAHRMIKAGSSDRKFLRQILVSVDITAPLYWYKEFDTYKVGTVANSTSTMHKLSSTPITEECFELSDFKNNLILYDKIEQYDLPSFSTQDMMKTIISYCETLRKKFLETKDQNYWKELIRWLPNGWLQTRTITLNYEILRNQYFQRKNHKLVEWHKYCEWIESLPYAKDLILYE